MSHVCPYGDSFCGRWGYSDLCEYCKKVADLDLQKREVEMKGEMACRQRQSRDEANAALAGLMVENPRATLGFLGAVAGVGLAAAIWNSKQAPAKKASKKK